MSDSIKPPGIGPSGAPAAGGAMPAVGATGDAFRAELERTAAASGTPETTGPSGAAPAAATPHAARIRSIAEDLRAGRIDATQAVERLLERTLSVGPAALLPPARRAELEALLRGLLQDDPTLSAMQRDLARAR